MMYVAETLWQVCNKLYNFLFWNYFRNSVTIPKQEKPQLLLLHIEKMYCICSEHNTEQQTKSKLSLSILYIKNIYMLHS